MGVGEKLEGELKDLNIVKTRKMNVIRRSHTPVNDKYLSPPERRRARVLQRTRGREFLEISSHEALQAPSTKLKLEAYMLQTIQTFLAVLQTIPVCNESITRLKNAFASSEKSSVA